MPKAKKKSSIPTKNDMLNEIIALNRLTNTLNTAVIALAYVMQLKGDELDKVDADKLVEFTTNHVHPLMRRADEIVKEQVEKTRKELEEKGKE